MLKSFFIFSVIIVLITDISCQYRIPENLSQNIQMPSYTSNTPLRPSAGMTSPGKMLGSNRMGIRRPRKPSRVNKRRYLEQFLKQSALRNIMAASNVLNRGAINASPIVHKLTATNSAAKKMPMN